MPEEVPSRCPVHGRDEPLWEWPCPTEPEPCPHFIAEIERRIVDMAAGNYWQAEHVSDGWIHHEYKNHEPTGRTWKLTAEEAESE